MFDRQPDPALRGIISNLNQVPPEFLAELQSADSELEAHMLLMHYAHESIRPYARAFIMEVLVDGHDSRTWRRGGVLVPDWSLPELLTHTVADLLTPLGCGAGSQLFLAPTSRARWEQRDPLVGAPALPRPDLDYTWKGGLHVARFPVTELSNEPVADLELAVRRWIASRLAMVADHQGALFTAAHPDDVIGLAGVDSSVVTEAGFAAGHGLIRELPLLRADVSLVPGFGGPPEFYLGG